MGLIKCFPERWIPTLKILEMKQLHMVRPLSSFLIPNLTEIGSPGAEHSETIARKNMFPPIDIFEGFLSMCPTYSLLGWRIIRMCRIFRKMLWSATIQVTNTLMWWG